MSKCSVSTSTILPLPSSPHCRPTTQVLPRVAKFMAVMISETAASCRPGIFSPSRDRQGAVRMQPPASFKPAQLVELRPAESIGHTRNVIARHPLHSLLLDPRNKSRRQPSRIGDVGLEQPP